MEAGAHDEGSYYFFNNGSYMDVHHYDASYRPTTSHLKALDDLVSEDES